MEKQNYAVSELELMLLLLLYRNNYTVTLSDDAFDENGCRA